MEFTLSLFGSMLLYFVMMGSSIIMPLYVQSIMGYSATLSGLVTLPGSLVMAIVSPFAGKIYDRIGIKKLFVAGALFMLTSNIGKFFITMNNSVWVASLYNTIRCAAIGCIMTAVTNSSLTSYGARAPIHGLNVTFLAMALSTTVLLAVAVFLVKPGKE